MRFVAAVLFTGALLFAQSVNIGSNHDAGPPQSPHPVVRLQLGESSTTDRPGTARTTVHKSGRTP